MEGPLGNVTVLDLSRALAGPQATMMLGDLGARVIKVEAPGSGDDTRQWGPPFVGEASERESTYFLSCNRNKESITLDLKDASDREVLDELIRRSDVLVENFRVGVMERLDLGPERLHRLNPRLVVLSLSGFGHDGPEAHRPGYDQIVQGEGGLMSLTGTEAPTKAGVPIADLLAGMNGAFGVVAALYEREATGRGRVVHTSLLAGVVGVHAFQGTRWTVAGERPGLSGTQHASIAPYGMFRTRTEPIQVACGSEGLWRSFASAIGLDPDAPEFATNGDRVEHRAELTGQIEGVLATADAERWLELLDEAGVPAGMVRSVDQVYEWKQTLSQGLLIEVAHQTQGTLRLPGPVLRFDENEYAGGRRHHLAPPTLGQHNDSIREWLARP